MNDVRWLYMNSPLYIYGFFFEQIADEYKRIYTGENLFAWVLMSRAGCNTIFLLASTFPS